MARHRHHSRTNGTASAFAQTYGVPMVEISRDVMDVARRIQEGDELWRGDPTMILCWNEMSEQYEVIGHDAKGNPYIALTSDTCDARILVALTESDWQRGSRAMIDRLVKAEEKAGRDLDRARRDANREIADKVAWGIRRAFAAHLGGRSTTYSMNSGRR